MNEKEDEIVPVVYTNSLDGIQDIIANGFPENVDLSSLFRSPNGKRFANQVQSQMEFTLVGILFPMVIELFVKIYPKLIGIISDVRFKSFYKDQVLETEDIDEKSRDVMKQIPDILEIMFDSLDEQTGEELDAGFDNIFGSKAKERFLGNMVFSLNSYLQAYIDSTIESLIRNKNTSVRTSFLEYWDSRKIDLRIGLLELDEISGDKYDAIAEIIRRSLTSNPLMRMRAICKAMHCVSELNQLVEKLDAKSTEDELRFLYEQRNRIAHGDPAPELEEYGLELEPLDWKEIQELLVDEVMKIWPDPPDGVFVIIELACDWAEKIAVADYFALLDYLPKTALLFPAIFDYVIDDAIRRIND